MNATSMMKIQTWLAIIFSFLICVTDSIEYKSQKSPIFQETQYHKHDTYFTSLTLTIPMNSQSVVMPQHKVHFVKTTPVQRNVKN